jgi:hypothetical protein
MKENKEVGYSVVSIFAIIESFFHLFGKWSKWSWCKEKKVMLVVHFS